MEREKESVNQGDKPGENIDRPAQQYQGNQDGDGRPADKEGHGPGAQLKPFGVVGVVGLEINAVGETGQIDEPAHGEGDKLRQREKQQRDYPKLCVNLLSGVE